VVFASSAIQQLNKGILHIFLCACAIRPYFYFRSKIGRHRRVSRPRFLTKRRNFAIQCWTRWRTYREVHMGFLIAPSGLTLDDLER